MTQAEKIIQDAMARRTAQGLKLAWFIPDQNRVFTAYAKSESQKQAWMKDAKEKGWELQS